MKEQSLTRQKSKNAIKLFNLCHSSLENTIKQIFRVDKEQCKILKIALGYDMITQIYLVFTMTTLHHYIKNYAIKKIDYFKEKIDKEIALIFISNNISFSTLLVISARINR